MLLGGVLGPSDGSHPDLRNLRLYYYACNHKDYIVLVSDGVHDTYDPEARGMLPEECGIKGAAWKDVTSAELGTTPRLSVCLLCPLIFFFIFFSRFFLFFF